MGKLKPVLNGIFSLVFVHFIIFPLSVFGVQNSSIVFQTSSPPLPGSIEAAMPSSANPAPTVPVNTNSPFIQQPGNSFGPTNGGDPLAAIPPAADQANIPPAADQAKAPPVDPTAALDLTGAFSSGLTALFTGACGATKTVDGGSAAPVTSCLGARTAALNLCGPNKDIIAKVQGLGLLAKNKTQSQAAVCQGLSDNLTGLGRALQTFSRLCLAAAATCTGLCAISTEPNSGQYFADCSCLTGKEANINAMLNQTNAAAQSAASCVKASTSIDCRNPIYSTNKSCLNASTVANNRADLPPAPSKTTVTNQPPPNFQKPNGSVPGTPSKAGDLVKGNAPAGPGANGSPSGGGPGKSNPGQVAKQKDPGGESGTWGASGGKSNGPAGGYADPMANNKYAGVIAKPIQARLPAGITGPMGMDNWAKVHRALHELTYNAIGN